MPRPFSRSFSTNPRQPTCEKQAATVNSLLPALSWEVGNALVLGIKEGRLTLDIATTALREYAEIPIRTIPVDRAEALSIAHAEDIYAYDAYMLCAHRHSAPLLTLDLQLRSVARGRDVELRPEMIEGNERYE